LPLERHKILAPEAGRVYIALAVAAQGAARGGLVMNRKMVWGAIVGLVLCGTTPTWAAPGVTLTVLKNKSQQSVDWDDLRQSVRMEVKVKNMDAKKALTGLKGAVYVFVKREDRMLRVADATTAEFDLPAGGQYAFTGGGVTVQSDRNGSVQYGESIDGYVVVIRDAQDKVIASKGKATYLKLLSKLDKLSVNQIVSRTLDPMK